MGCAASKVEDLPAVALCRDRCKYLEEALSQSQALADAHVAYLASLRTLGPALHRFFHDIHASPNGPDAPASESEEECSTASSSASHIQFPSDSSESESEDKDPLKWSEETPAPVYDDQYITRACQGEAFINSSGGLAKASKAPPPPPSPISSTWDFLNLFDAFERERYLVPLYSCTNLDPEALAAADKVKVDSGGLTGDQEGLTEKSKKAHLATSTTPPSVSIKHNKHKIHKKQSKQKKQGVGSSVPADAEAQAEAMRELHLLFDRASESGNQVLKSLQSHHHTIYVHQEYGFDEHEGLAMSSHSLSYTLQTLSLWEKKLYDEVKAEERLRVAHEKKSRMLKHLEHNKNRSSTNVDSPKTDSLRTALRNLVTKMKISIQIVDRISVTINNLRDEELWPQIVEFIHRLLGMWKGMVECHKSQYQAIAKASKGLDGISISNVKLNGAHDLETAIQLKLELQNWNVCFSNWIVTQKRYVKALNGWLLRCLLLEPLPQQESTAKEEEEEEGAEVVPLSPGSFGALPPPVFVICNEWSQAMDRLSEKEVTEAIRGSCTSIQHLLSVEHRTDAEMVQQRMVTENKDLARKVRYLEEEEDGKEQKIFQKVMRGRGKKNVNALSSLRAAGEESGVRLQQSEKNNNLVWDMKQTLMAMEKFTANSLQAYKELHAHISLDKSALSTQQ